MSHSNKKYDSNKLIMRVFLAQRALATLCILMHKFLGAVLLCTLCGDRLDAEHKLSKNIASIRLVLVFIMAGMVEIYSSALVIALSKPRSS